MDYFVEWRPYPEWIDYYPGDVLSLKGAGETKHPIVGPKGEHIYARCDYTQAGSTLTLFYGGKHTKENEECGVDIGYLRITFAAIADAPRFAWSDDGKKFSSANVRRVTPVAAVYAREGLRVSRWVTRATRNRGLQQLALKLMVAKNGGLICSQCGLDAAERYGEFGLACFQVHHINHIRHGVRDTRLNELAPMCANCHFVVHARDG